MFRTAVTLCMFLIAAAPAGARDDAQCIPKDFFPKDPQQQSAALKLGFASGIPTLCASGVVESADQAAFKKCWAIDAKTGALSASTATRLAGRSSTGMTGADGCAETFCPLPSPGAEQKAVFARSTDDTRAVVFVKDALHVFDARTKKQTAVIPIRDEKAASDTNIGNEPIAILYLGHTLCVLGADAGPFTGVWIYSDDDKRLGKAIDAQKAGQEDATFSVFAGAANIIDERHVAVADAGLRTVQILDEAGKKVAELKRPVATAPCTADDLISVEIADIDRLPKRCLAHVQKTFAPYFDVDPIRLPDGDLLVAMSGKYLGTLAVLDGKTLAEKRRMMVKRCR